MEVPTEGTVAVIVHEVPFSVLVDEVPFSVVAVGRNLDDAGSAQPIERQPGAREPAREPAAVAVKDALEPAPSASRSAPPAPSVPTPAPPAPSVPTPAPPAP